MAGLTLITIAHVLAILVQTCTSEIPGLPLEYSGHNSVVYVPVCSPDCAKSLYHHHHPIINCQEKVKHGDHRFPDTDTRHFQQLLGDLPLDHGHVGLQQQASYGHPHHGSASVHQQIHPHGYEQQLQVHHGHGTSTSQQSFQHEPHGSYDEHGHEDHHHKKNAHYKFEYSVNDHKTGDVKRHKEERKGDVVNGEYSLLEEDGNVRTVTYYADWKSGFHARVHNSKKSVG